MCKGGFPTNDLPAWTRLAGLTLLSDRAHTNSLIAYPSPVISHHFRASPHCCSPTAARFPTLPRRREHELKLQPHGRLVLVELSARPLQRKHMYASVTVSRNACILYRSLSVATTFRLTAIPSRCRPRSGILSNNTGRIQGHPVVCRVCSSSARLRTQILTSTSAVLDRFLCV